MKNKPNWPSVAARECTLLGKADAATTQAADVESPVPLWSVEGPDEDLFGLALSGGGIRSATFNLGLLQGLDKLNILDKFDYLSTVSGGGYLGGFWSAWLSRPNNQRFPAEKAGEEAREVRHLREFSNFLRPRLSLLSMETGRIAANLAAALLPSLLAALAVLFLFLYAWLGVAWLLQAEEAGRWPTGWVEGLAPAFVLCLLTLGLLWIFELSWYYDPQEPHSQGMPSFFIWSILSSLVAGAVWWLLWPFVPIPFPFLLRPVRLAEAGPWLATALLPALAWGAAALTLMSCRGLLSRWFARGSLERVSKDALDRALARHLLCLAGWSLVGGLWVLGQVLASEGLSGLFGALGAGAAGGGAFAWARKLLGAQPNKPTGGKLLERLRPCLPQVLAIVTLAAVTAGVAALLVLVSQAGGPVWVASLLGINGLLLALTLLVFEPHESGLHAFYRARLVRAYLGASNPHAEARTTSECEGDDVQLDDLPSRPLHLICCTANDLHADPLGTLHRGAESAVLSKLGLQVGAHWHRWRPSGFKRRSPWLGAAMTASGAAFNSHMGAKSMRLGPAATFLLAALNLRLGLWLENPGAPRRGRFLARLPHHLPGLLFFRELLGSSDAHSSWVYLSDGGHFENLALYELVRRHCRYILVSDCGADPEVAFDDLGNAIRRIREDFGVEIEIDPTPLRPGPTGHALQPMVAGTIRYSPTDAGILLYVKPTLVGDEPADIAQYDHRNADFPHESTLDQFYDEAQWESYRKLGEHIALRALEDCVAENQDSLARLFLRARYVWLPGGLDDPAILTELEHAWAELEERVESDPALPSQFLPDTDGEIPAEALTLALPLLLEAMRLMEAIYHRTGMSATSFSASHPRYLGWLNRFGRWASSPPFRAWWRWLAPLYSQPFARFLQESFQLPELRRWCGRVDKIDDSHRNEYTWKRWQAMPKAHPVAGTYDTYGFFVPLKEGGTAQELLAGIVEIERKEENGTTVVTWARDHFFVPPGLWGVGIGEAFLDALIEKLSKELGPCLARVDTGEISEAWDGLYSGAGFSRGPCRFERKLDAPPLKPAPLTPPGPPAPPSPHPPGRRPSRGDPGLVRTVPERATQAADSIRAAKLSRSIP